MISNVYVYTVTSNIQVCQVVPFVLDVVKLLSEEKKIPPQAKISDIFA